MPSPRPASSTPTSAITVFLLFTLLALAYNFNVFLGPYGAVRIHDTFDSEFVQYAIRGDLLMRFGPFAWIPGYAGGMPSFAGHLSVFYPLSLLAALLPLWLVYWLFLITLTTLAGYGMYRLTRILFQVDRRLALFGGLAFVFGLLTQEFNVPNMAFNFVFPIFFVWSIELFGANLGAMSRAWRLGGLIGLALLSYPVLTLPFFPILHLTLVWAFLPHSADTRKLLAQIVLLWTGYVLLCVPNLYALYRYIPLAQREYAYHYPGFFPALADFAFALKRTLLTQPALPVLLWGLPLVKSSPRLRRAWLLAGLALGVHALFASPFRCWFSHTLLAKMDLSHFDFVLNTCTALIAVLVVAEFINPRTRLPIWPLVLIVPIIGLQSDPLTAACILGLAWSVVALVRGADDLPQPEAGSGKLKLARVLLGVTLALLGIQAQREYLALSIPYQRFYRNHAELERLASEAGKEVFRVGSVDSMVFIPQSYGLETVDQRGPLFNKHYKQFFQAIIQPQLDDPKDRKSFQDYWYNLYLTPFHNPSSERSGASWNMPLLLMMNVKYLISGKPITGIEPYGDLVAVDQGQGGLGGLFPRNINRLYQLPLWIYRLREPFPRGFLASQAIILPNSQEVLRQLSRESQENLRQSVWFNAQDVPGETFPQHPVPVSGRGDRLRLTEYRPDRLVFQGNAVQPVFLVVTNNFDRGWRARLNGAEVPIWRANHAFQAVLINPPGPFQVELNYYDPAVWWLHIGLMAGLGLIIGSTLYLRKSGLSSDAAIPELKEPRGPVPLGRFSWPTAISGVIATFLWIGMLVMTAKVTLKDYNVVNLLTVGILLSLWAGWLVASWLTNNNDG